MQDKFWFSKTNYPSKWMTQESRDICKKIVEKYKKLEAEAHKPKPRKKKK